MIFELLKNVKHVLQFTKLWKCYIFKKIKIIKCKIYIYKFIIKTFERFKSRYLNVNRKA